MHSRIADRTVSNFSTLSMLAQRSHISRASTQGETWARTKRLVHYFDNRSSMSRVAHHFLVSLHRVSCDECGRENWSHGSHCAFSHLARPSRMTDRNHCVGTHRPHYYGIGNAVAPPELTMNQANGQGVFVYVGRIVTSTSRWAKKLFQPLPMRRGYHSSSNNLQVHHFHSERVKRRHVFPHCRSHYENRQRTRPFSTTPNQRNDAWAQTHRIERGGKVENVRETSVLVPNLTQTLMALK